MLKNVSKPWKALKVGRWESQSADVGEQEREKRETETQVYLDIIYISQYQVTASCWESLS